ncbi:triose-phosphate isomerase [Desulfonatronum thioautotrophicum]|uniref:triose-phosphate isomerase n=1 Tax=Desulfonatronum thioautotrophicum TaxID=617001 RepID=UPI0005EB3749|nr:triose-phosphate isomerase [Desulfonatronum thioautotrophicum]
MSTTPKTLIAGNWKMYKTEAEAVELASGLAASLHGNLSADREVLLLPPFTALKAVAETILGRDKMLLGGQNFYPSSEGAFTGEIAPFMLADAGCTHALAGHSERRHVLKESDRFIAQKTAFGLQFGLHMILCIGETLDQRTHGSVENVLKGQLRLGLAEVNKDEVTPEHLSIAYEPVWAIGTGKVAQNEDIIAAHDFIRKTLVDFFPHCGSNLRILYGGSVKADNAGTILRLDNVNGVLVGGASLQVESFAAIATAA